MPWHRTARPTPAGAAPCPLDRRSPCPAALHRQLLITRSASLDLHLRRGGPDDARQRHGEHANVSDGHDRSPLTHLGLHTGHHGDVPRPRNTQYRHVRLRSTSSTALIPSLVYCYSATDQTSSKFWSLLVTVSPSVHGPVVWNGCHTICRQQTWFLPRCQNQIQDFSKTFKNHTKDIQELH